MRKRIITGLICLSFIAGLTGCGEEITLHLSYGDRTGRYSGDMVDGVPHGQGKFTTENAEGDKWTYEGEFKNGHFDGEGKTTWESGQVEIGTYKEDVIVPLKGDEIKSLYTNPEEFKDHYVELIGEVFAAEYDEDLVCFQMWEDYENIDNNTIVYVYDEAFEVADGDYVKIVGKVGDVFEGENSFGGVVTAPTITASEYEIISYVDAVMPTLKTIDVNQTETQLGYSVTVQKVELAEKETRVYVKVENNGANTFTLYGFNTKLSQGGKQYDEEANWEADYPELQSELLAGNMTEGIITFPAIEEEAFTLTFEGYSEDYEEQIAPYTIKVDLSLFIKTEA